MVKNLRRKFMLTAMASLFIVIVVLIAAINLINLSQTNRASREVLLRLAQGTEQGHGSGGRIPRPDRFSAEKPVGVFSPDDGMLRYMREAELPFQMRYFTAVFSAETGEIAQTDLSHIAALTAEDAQILAMAARNAYLTQGRTEGTKGVYRYLVSITGEDALRIVFLDRTEDLTAARRLFMISLTIGFLALLAMFVLVWLFSSRAVAPLAESLEKQKRFISDAGHELKTPLTVIGADIDVLELDGVKNEWTASVRTQVRRMNELIGNLLTVSRMEEASVRETFTDCDFSRIVTSCRESFLPVAEERGCGYTADIAPDIFVRGDQEALERLSILLFDNALKYCAIPGAVIVRLERAGRSARLEISNPCDRLPEGRLDRLFDRFYRADASRSRKSGGYGLGLSAAKAITLSHGGTIVAVRDGERTIRFMVQLPLSGAPPRQG